MNKVDDKNGTDSWIYIIMEDGTVGWVFQNRVTETQDKAGFASGTLETRRSLYDVVSVMIKY